MEIGIVIIEKYKSNNKSLHYSSDYTFLNKFSNYVQNKFSKQKKLALSESLILTFAKQIDSLPNPNEELNIKNTDIHL